MDRRPVKNTVIAWLQNVRASFACFNRHAINNHRSRIRDLDRSFLKPCRLLLIVPKLESRKKVKDDARRQRNPQEEDGTRRVGQNVQQRTLAPAPARRTTTTTAAPNAAVAAAAAASVARETFDRLRNEPRVPNIPSSLPPTMMSLLETWRLKDLSQYATPTAKKNFSNKMRMMYSKWSYLYSLIKKRAEHGNFAPVVVGAQQRMEAAARAYDTEHDDLTMNQFYERLKRNDPTVKKRKTRGEILGHI